jgi:DNA polymerase III epsilon subunit-like protein
MKNNINKYLLHYLMSKSRKICVVYTETNGLHTTNEDVIKKNLYGFARLVVLNYEIGYKEGNKFVSIKKVRSIIKPRCMHISEDSINIHGITMEIANNEGIEIEEVLESFIKNLIDISVIVSHNVNFHLKTIMAELVRYNKPFSFSNYIIIDTISFFHNLTFPKLDNLYTTIVDTKKSKKNVQNLDKIRLCFLKLYENYEQSLI